MIVAGPSSHEKRLWDWSLLSQEKRWLWRDRTEAPSICKDVSKEKEP